MKPLRWLDAALGFPPSVHVDESESLELAADAYDLLDELPPGPERVAAWNAYALQTYADKLAASVGGADHARSETHAVVSACRDAAVVWTARAEASGRDDGAGLPERLPRWPTPIRSTEQLRGMRDALDALRTHIAYDLGAGRGEEPSPFADDLALVDAKLEAADRLWIERPPPEIRGGVGDALMRGLDAAYALGGRVAATRSGSA